MTTYTDEQLQAIVEGARERSGWIISHDNPKYRKGCSSIYDSATMIPQVSFGGASTETAQFIIDAIQALPQMQAKIDQLEARLQAVGEWESVDDPPTTSRANNRGFAFSENLEILAITSGYYRSNGDTGSFFDSDVGHYLEAVGWRYVESENHDPR